MPSNKKIQITDAGGTNLFPRNSLDNIQVSKTDNTDITLVTEIGATGSTAALPTEHAVREALNEKQDTLIKGSNVLLHGNTVSVPDASMSEKGAVQIDTADSNGVSLEVDGGTVKVNVEKASTDGFGTVKVNTSDSNGVSLEVDGGTVKVNAEKASTDGFGTVKVNTSTSNGVSLEVDGGTVKVNAAKASTDAFGTVKVNTSDSNGVSLEVDGGTVKVNTEKATNGSPGVIAGATNGVQLVDGVAQFDNTTVDAATPADIVGGTANKVIQADDLEAALALAYQPVRVPDLHFTPSTSGVVTLSEFGLDYTGTMGEEETQALIDINQLPIVGEKHGIFIARMEVINRVQPQGNNNLQIGGSGFTDLTSIGLPGMTTEYNIWTPLYVKFDTRTTLVPGAYFRLRTRNKLPANFDYGFRNLVFINVTNVPASKWYDIATSADSSYLYEPDFGIKFLGNRIGVDEAEPSDMFSGTDTKAMTPNSLKSTMSVGQAVDCTAAPLTDPSATLTDVDGNPAVIDNVYHDTFTLAISGATSMRYIGFPSGHAYPKAAVMDDGTPLKYLIMFNITNNGSTTIRLGITGTREAGTKGTLSQLKDVYIAPEASGRFASIFWANKTAVNSTLAEVSIYSGGATDWSVTLSKMREFEITHLADDAIKYLAGVTDPDNADSLYLIKNDMVDPWVNIINMGSAPTVTLASGLAYKSTVVSGSTCTFNTDTVPAGTYGKDAHLSLFVGLDSQIIFKQPLNLIDPLTPGAGHNMTIKYRDGQALAYVDDTDIGYVVTVCAGTENGSLYYGISGSTDSYVIFSRLLDGQAVSVATDATLTKGFNLLGNGTDKTIVSIESSISCAAKDRYFRDMKVTASSAGYLGKTGAAVLSFKNCLIEGCVTAIGKGRPVHIEDCVVTGNTVDNALFDNDGQVEFKNTSFYGNTGTGYIAGIHSDSNYVDTCYFSNNGLGYALNYISSELASTLLITGSTFATTSDAIRTHSNETVTFAGTNIIKSSVDAQGTVNIQPDAILDLTGNQNATVISASTIQVLDGGTASVIAYDGSTVSIAGSGTCLANDGTLS